MDSLFEVKLEKALGFWCEQQYGASTVLFDEIARELSHHWAGHLGAGITRIHHAEWLLEEAGVPFNPAIGYAQKNTAPAMILPLNRLSGELLVRLRNLVSQAQQNLKEAERRLPDPPPPRLEAHFQRICAGLTFHLGESFLFEESLDPSNPLQQGGNLSVSRFRERERVIKAVENRETSLKVSEQVNWHAFPDLRLGMQGDILAFTANLWALYGFFGVKKIASGYQFIPGVSRDLTAMGSGIKSVRKLWRLGE